MIPNESRSPADSDHVSQPPTGPVIGRTTAQSRPHHGERPRPAGAPNVVVVMLDDVGFGQLGPFGAVIDTPTLDALADDGLRYNRFHVTAICSPSRAAMLTGRNAHAVGVGFLADLPSGYPGYQGRIPRSAATVARVLKDGGYNTMAVGKWHLTPRNDRSAAGPFDTWPLALGFEKYYGFLHGDANQWTPTLVRDNSPVETPATPQEGYHLTEDLVDEALAMITDQKAAAPEKPFFLYFAPGVGHAPHQAPPEWIERYAGRFDAGWDVLREQIFERQMAAGVVPEGTELPERPEYVQAWDSLSAEEQRLFARFAEAHAGFVSHFDHHLGRLMAGLVELGIDENTMVVVTSDNGASAEGGRVGSVNEHRFGFGVADSLEDNLAGEAEIGGFGSYNHYPWGWAWLGNTPFKLWKRYTWLGGTRTPLIVRPAASVAPLGAAAGGVREQVCHLVDLFPTILETCGVAAPAVVDGVEQLPVEGRSMVSTFTDPNAPEIRTTQYFEMLGSRSIIHDGWKATTDHVSGGVLDEDEFLTGSRDFDTDTWHLYRLADDFAECRDVAAEHPEVVAELERVWWAEAERNQVLPLTDSLYGHMPGMEPALWPVPQRLVLRPGGRPLADEAVPSLSMGTLLEADVEVPTGGGAGVLAAIGDWSNGWALVVLDGRLTFLLNVVSSAFSVQAPAVLPTGRHRVGFRLVGGDGVLVVDGQEVHRDALPLGLGASGIQIGGGGLRLGHDAGFPVADVYAPPFAWTGTLHTVTFSGPGTLDADLEKARALIALRSE